MDGALSAPPCLLLQLDLDPADRINGAAMVNVWHTQYWFTDRKGCCL